MRIENVRNGNILFGAVVIKPEDLTASQIADVYEVRAGAEREKHVNRLLASAQERKLLGLELSDSYGAECMALAQSAEIHPDFLPP